MQTLAAMGPHFVEAAHVVSGPTIGTLAISPTNWDGLHAAKFVGLANNRTLRQAAHFTFALANNFKWLLRTRSSSRRTCRRSR